MPYRIVAEHALARWRAAQAIVDTAEHNSDEWRNAYREAEAAKAAYEAAVGAARVAQLPEPPPFPGAGTDAATGQDTVEDVESQG